MNICNERDDYLIIFRKLSPLFIVITLPYTCNEFDLVIKYTDINSNCVKSHQCEYVLYVLSVLHKIAMLSLPSGFPSQKELNSFTMKSTTAI